jgi:hypothetical protein
MILDDFRGVLLKHFRTSPVPNKFRNRGFSPETSKSWFLTLKLSDPEEFSNPDWRAVDDQRAEPRGPDHAKQALSSRGPCMEYSAALPALWHAAIIIIGWVWVWDFV